MSSRTESDQDTGRSVLDLFEDWYHVPALVIIVGVMLRLRLLAMDNFTRDGEVFFSGNDAWYHFRETAYVVRHWPFTMPFDPWTGFPVGNASGGQFGSLYDQIVATVALIVGLGDPGSTLVAKTVLVAPAVFGALAAVPTYYVGKRLGGRLAGLFGATVLMLLPGSFLSRTLVGAADHNAVEPFFQAAAVVPLLVAFAVAERDKPVWELVEARDWDALTPSLRWGAIAGAATAVYLWVWPPGVLLVAAVAVFLVLKLSSDVYNERSPEPVAFVTAVAMGVTALLMLLRIETFGFGTTNRSLLQPSFSLLVAVGAAFMAWLAREWESRDIDVGYYPYTILGLAVSALVLANLLTPSLYNILEGNFFRILAFSQSGTASTIAEAQPFLSASLRRGLSPTEQILTEYGFTFFSGVAAAVWLLAGPLVREGDSRRLGFVGASLGVIAVIFVFPQAHTAVGDALGVGGQVFGLFVVFGIIAVAAHLAVHDPEHLFVLVWAAFITAAAFTQVRFNYYLAVVVAVLNAYLFGEILRSLDLRGSVVDRVDEIQAYQVLVVVAAVMLVLLPVLAVPLGVGPEGSTQTRTAWQNADSHGPGAITQWDGTLQWMHNQTPRPGSYGGADTPMEYYGTYDRTEDFDYPAGAYGVQSWWDYGHWITLRAERIPNANPFQQGATRAANYLLAPSEQRAETLLDAPAGEGERTRFVMVDWQMVSTNSKFGAPVVFYDDGNASRTDFFQRVWGQQFRSSFNLHHQRYYESQMVRLYNYHGSAREPTPIVVDWRVRTVTDRRTGEQLEVRTAPGDGTYIKTFDNMSAARQFVREDGSAQVGGIGPYPAERVPALQHYRLVKVSEPSALNARGFVRGLAQVIQTTRLQQQNLGLLSPQTPAWVKVFERVPGATIDGSNAPPNASVTASVEMRIPTTNETFTYTQRARADENGEFTMVLPYSTTGYEAFGPENGYTNASVRATGPYTFTVQPQVSGTTVVQYGARANVSEARVVGAEEGPKQVALERRERNLTIQAGSGQRSADPFADDPRVNGGAVAGSTASAAPTPTDAGTTGSPPADG